MDQVREYLGYALYAAFIVSYVVLLVHFLLHKQWKMVLLSLFFAFTCVPGGFLIALVIGWQEARNWKILNLMRLYSVLLVICFIMSANYAYKAATTPSKPEESLIQQKQRALRGATLKK